MTILPKGQFVTAAVDFSSRTAAPSASAPPRTTGAGDNECWGQRLTPCFAPGIRMHKNLVRDLVVRWPDVDSIHQLRRSIPMPAIPMLVLFHLIPAARPLSARQRSAVFAGTPERNDSSRAVLAKRCLQYDTFKTIHSKRYMRLDSIASARRDASRQTDRKMPVGAMDRADLSRFWPVSVFASQRFKPAFSGAKADRTRF